MKYLMFNWDLLPTDVNISDPSDLTDGDFETLAIRFGSVYKSVPDFESAFNSEHFSTHTHQLRIITVE